MLRRSTGPLVSLLALALPLVIGACSRDTYALDTVTELGELTDELVAKVEATEDKPAGVAEAQALLDSRTAALEPRINEVLGLRGYQIGDETARKVAVGLEDSAVKMSMLQLDLVTESAKDPELQAALDQLIAAHEALLDGS